MPGSEVCSHAFSSGHVLYVEVQLENVESVDIDAGELIRVYTRFLLRVLFNFCCH
jgi:hypothetical protein